MTDTIKSIPKFFNLALTSPSGSKVGFLALVCRSAMISMAVTFAYKKVYEAFFGPLSHIPGPLICKFVNVPGFILDRPIGTLFKSLIKLHGKYGRAVRIGPRQVSVSDKNMIKQVLQTDDLGKGPLYKAISGSNDTMFTTTDRAFHKRMRRLVSSGFSVSYINSLEPYVQSVADTVTNKINSTIVTTADQSGYGTIDVWSLMQHFTLDIIGETLFGESFEMVEKGNHFLPKEILARSRMIGYAVCYPTLVSAYLGLRSSAPYRSFNKIMRKLRSTPKRKHPKTNDYLYAIYTDRKNSAERRNDILQVLMDTQDAEDPEDRLSTDEIIKHLLMFLVAGSETTSNIMGFAILELLKTPEALQKLYEEIDTLQASEEEGTTFTHKQLKDLPYLNSVIYETMRIYHVSADGIQRKTAKDINLAGKLQLPKDTIILGNTQCAQIDPGYWSDPLTFKPERWINKELNTQDDFGAYFPFSAGSRNCIGMNLAWIEMRINLATIIKNFDIQPIEKEMKEANNLIQHFITSVASYSFNIKIKQRIH